MNIPDWTPLMRLYKELEQRLHDTRRCSAAWKASAKAHRASAIDFGEKLDEFEAEILQDNAQLAAQVGALRDALEPFICPIIAERLQDSEDSYAKLPDDLQSQPPGTYGDVKRAITALDLTPPDALAEIDAQVRGEERERCAGYLDVQAAKQEAAGTMLGAAMTGIYRKHAANIREAADA